MFRPRNISEFTKIIMSNYSKREADIIVANELRRAEVILAGEVTMWLRGEIVGPDNER
jgi:hypothetical protein